MKHISTGLLFSLALLVGHAAVAGEPAAAIFDKIAASYGATPPAAIVQSGSTTSKSRGVGALKRLFRAPDRFRSEIKYSSGHEVRTLQGPLAWSQGVPANATVRSAIALQAARVALPWNMLGLKSTTVDKGTETHADGKIVQLLEFPIESGLKMVLEVEVATGHILRSLGILTVGTQAMEFATRYSDFRSANGRTYAGHEEQYAMGQHIGDSVIESVEYPPTLPDNTFEPVASAQFAAN